MSPLPKPGKHIRKPCESEFANSAGNFKKGRRLGLLLRVLQFIPRLDTRLRNPQDLYDEIEFRVIPERTVPSLDCCSVPPLRRSTIEDVLSPTLYILVSVRAGLLLTPSRCRDIPERKV